MKTTTLILTAAVVATTLFSCGKKDDSSDEKKFSVSSTQVTLIEGGKTTIKVSTPANSLTIVSSNENVATATPQDKTVMVQINGEKEGTAVLTITDPQKNSAKVNVTVNKKTSQSNGKRFEVKSDIIFLKKNEETDVTGWVKKGSGNYTVSTPNTSVVKEAGKKNGKLYAIGSGEGLTDKLKFKDLDYNEELEVPVYVIVPFTAVGVPASMAVNDVQTFNLTGVYNTGSLQNGRYDRVTITANNGKVEATLVTKDIKAQGNNQGTKLGELVTGIKITAKEAGEAVIQLTNGDGQSLQIKFTVTAYVANNYFNVNADGVLTVKSGVILPAEVVLPSNAKKVAEKAFKNQPNVTSIDFNNVTEIEGSLFDNVANPTGINITKVIMRKVEKVGYDTFRNAVHLKVIEFPSTLKFLGNQSLFGCNSLRAVAFRSTTPPKGMTYSGSELEKAENALDTDRNNRVRLFIPIGSATAYQTALNTNSKFRYLKGAKGVNWYTGDTHQAIVDIANFDKVDFSKL